MVYTLDSISANTISEIALLIAMQMSMTIEIAVLCLVYIGDYSESLHNQNMDTQSAPMSYYMGFLFGSTFRLCSTISTITITLYSYP
jgi:hypothetical protein